MERSAMSFFLKQQGELFTHDDLFRALYGNRPYNRDSTALRVLMTKLRRLLQISIKARWGKGYIVSGIIRLSRSGPQITAPVAAIVQARDSTKTDPSAVARSHIPSQVVIVPPRERVVETRGLQHAQWLPIHPEQHLRQLRPA